MKQKKKNKVKKLSWKGVLAGRSRVIRITVWVLIALSSIALTFTQYGFAGIGQDGAYTAYAIVLLQPIAIAALLLGTLAGTAIGLLSGAALLLHATFMPLDFFELTFVSPTTSILLLTVTGFLFGIMFAIALRNDPSIVKRTIYICIVSIIVSFLFSMGFISNVFVHIIEQLVESAVEGMSESEATAYAQQLATVTLLRLGNVELQFYVDTLLIISICILGDLLARKTRSLEGSVALRSLFGTWLFVVFLMSFLITSVVGFVAITEKEKADTEVDMRSEVSYLCTQIEKSVERSVALEKGLDATHAGLESLNDEAFDAFIASTSMDGLLNGYSRENDGTVFVCIDDTLLLLSNDERIPVGDDLANYTSKPVLDAIKASVETARMQRIVFDDPEAFANEEGGENIVKSQLAYLYSKQTDIQYENQTDVDANYTVTIIKPSRVVFANRGATMAVVTLVALALLLAMFVLTWYLLKKLVVNRIDETNSVLARVMEGDLDAKVDIHDTNEFSSLTDGINSTVHTLKGWIAEAESRMDAELATAREIQESALPRIFPPYPDILRFDIFATMRPAREVGGDFYDFFLIGNDCDADRGKLGFVMADVSGKGVPAALFMMKSMTQLRDYMTSGMDLGQAVENTNRQLCEGNDAGMFVTIWAGILDYATNQVEFVNAGHNPPLFWHDGKWEWVSEKSGMPLGLFDGLPYESFTRNCTIGDQFLLYTDGVTEAMNENGELFGEDRLEQVASDNFTLHPRALLRAVRRAVIAHANGAEQSDDITMLALEVGVPPEITVTLTVPATVEELPRVNRFIHSELDRRLCPLRAQKQLDIAVEELFVNVAHYAYPNATPDNPGIARISYTYSAEPPSITVDIADDGIPYNPLEKPDAVTPEDINEVPIGGLGILMAKRSVNEMTYNRIDCSNIVTIVKKW